RGFVLVWVLPSENLPPVSLTRLTDKSIFPFAGGAVEGGAGEEAFAPFVPRLEKFQAPDGACSKVTAGASTVRPVTCSRRENASADKSTPRLSDFAVRNGSRLNAGSSATERSSVATLPDRSDSLRLPTFTARPSAELRFDSSIGRNWLASIRNGRLTSAST